MHSLQQTIENNRTNPPIGSVPGSYMLNTIQYYPSSSQAHLDSHGRSLYPDNVNKLAIPNEYRRPSSAPLTPVEPKKIGRRFRRSSSVEEPHPDTLMMHESDLRRNNGLSRHELPPSGICVRTCDGKISASDPNRIVSASHFSTIDGSIMSHTRPISYNYRHEYDAKRIKTETDSKEINYRPYMENHHPYNNIKKNLSERFMKVEDEDVRSSFKSSNTSSSSSSSYHTGTSKHPPENYFTWSQYPPQNQESSYYSKVNMPPHARNMDSGSFRGSYPSDSFLTRPHHSETRPHHSETRPHHSEARPHHSEARPHHSEPRPHHSEQMPIRPSHADHLSVRPHHNDPILTRPPMHKGEQDARLQAMNTYFEMMANVQQVGNTPDGLFIRSREVIIQKGGGANPNAPTVIHNQMNHSTPHHPHHHDFHEKSINNQQSVVRHPHHLDMHEKGMTNQQGTIRYPPHDLHEKGVSTHQPTVIRGGIDSSGGSSSHNIHGMTRPTNPPWSMVPTGDVPSHEKERTYFHPPPTNAMDCGCAYPKRHLGECKLRNESFKRDTESEHEEHTRYINMRATPSQYEISNPYESPQYRRPDKVHPPELISYHDKLHNEYMNTPPNRAVKEMVTPPVLKNEAIRPDCTTSPSNIKKTPRPGPLVIPPTINNKIIYSTPCAMGRSNLPLSIYTPPPMLSPKSVFFNPPLSFQKVYTPAQTGYVCQTPRRVSLIDKHEVPTPAAVSVASIEKQLSVEAPEPKINVGPQFQATVPNVSDKAEAHKDVHRAGLMWSPLKEDKLKCNEVSEYLEMACSLALYGGGTNKEYALHILQRTRGNVKEAIRLLLSRRHILRADDPNADYHYSGSIRWNAKERLMFRTAYRTKGKIFAEIQKEIGTKSVQLCVEFYYLWKAKHPESFRVRTRTVEAESEQDEDEVPPTPTAAVAPLSTLREPVFECDYPDCLARFISRQALNGHIRVHGGSHTKTPDSRRPPKEKANATPRTAPDGSIINSPPKKKKAANRPTGPTPPGDGPPLQFQCKVCGRVFSKVKSRSAHMKTHVKKDENNKPIKTQKTKVAVEIQPLHKPFDILMHAVNNIGHSYDSTKHSSSISVHNTQPTYNPSMDNTKPPFNSSVNNTKPPFNPPVDHTKPPPPHHPVDSNKPPFNPSMDNSKPSFHPSMDNTKPSHQSVDNTKPPHQSVDNTKPPHHPSLDKTKLPFNPSLIKTEPQFHSSMDNTKPIFNPAVENTKPKYDHIVMENTKSSFDKNNNNSNNNNISSVNPST